MARVIRQAPDKKVPKPGAGTKSPDATRMATAKRKALRDEGLNLERQRAVDNPPGPKAPVCDAERRRLAMQLNGLSPLEFAISMMRDPAASIPEKQWACAVLLPYMHRKMPVAIDVGGQKENPINVKNMSTDELAAFVNLCQKAGIALPKP